MDLGDLGFRFFFMYEKGAGVLQGPSYVLVVL